MTRGEESEREKSFQFTFRVCAALCLVRPGHMSQLMVVTVPQGVSPGQPLLIQANGQQLQVVVPQGCLPGSQFQVQVPAAAPVAPQAAVAPSVQQLFWAVDTERSGAIDKHELQRALSSGAYQQFQMRTTELLIRMSDSDRSGNINIQEFETLWNNLQQWKRSFDSFDADRSGAIDKSELHTSLAVCGYQLSPQTISLMMSKYDADSSGAISLDEFIQLNVELSILTESFRKHDTQQNGWAQISYETFLQMVLEARV